MWRITETVITPTLSYDGPMGYQKIHEFTLYFKTENDARNFIRMCIQMHGREIRMPETKDGTREYWLEGFTKTKLVLEKTS